MPIGAVVIILNAWFETRREWARTQGNGDFSVSTQASGAGNAKFRGEVGLAIAGLTVAGLDPQSCQYPLAWDDFNASLPQSVHHSLRLFNSRRVNRRRQTSPMPFVVGYRERRGL